MIIYETCRNYLETKPERNMVMKHSMDILNKINIHTKKVKEYAQTNGSSPERPLSESVAKSRYFKIVGMKHLEHQKKVMEFILSDVIVEL